jgi:protocatechuate 3,4-dioxygenase alpha subunit
VTVFARGLLDRLFTRAYLSPDDISETVPPDRRHTLLAAEDETGYRFDVRLQGEDETVFFRFPGYRV